MLFSIDTTPSMVVKAAQDMRAALARAAGDAGRPLESTSLMIVSKFQPAIAIRPLLAAGFDLFGENRVQEARDKWPALRADYPAAQLALIGPLQSNKVREAVALFDAIHSLDRPKLAQALAAEIARQGRCPRLYVQVNTGEEPQKAGLAPGELDDFLHACRDEWGLTIAGLMCIPPHNQQPAPHFALLAQLADRHGLAQLSMGMSGDYASAIMLGSTCVRIGTAIFGARPLARTTEEEETS